MTGDTPPQPDDLALILRIRKGDEGALREMLKAYGPKVKGYLIRTYGNVLHTRTEIEAALNQATFRVWRYAHRFDPSKGSLKGWFLRIAQRAALSIIEDKQQHLAVDLESVVELASSADDDHEGECDKQKRQRITDLDNVIEHKLQGLQQAIIRADLACGGNADAGRLAHLHRTTRNSIHVSRHKARENIRKFMQELESDRK